MKQISVSELLMELNSPFAHRNFFLLTIWRKSVYRVFEIFSNSFLPCLQINRQLLFVPSEKLFKQSVSLASMDNVFVERSMAKVLVHLYSEVIIILICTVFLGLY